MKRIGFLMLALAVSIYLFGCGKKQQTLEEMQEPMSIETLGVTPSTTTSAPAQAVPQPAAPAAELKLETLPAPVSGKPTALEIQTALKNAGYYTGNLDGKLGPRTKQAIEEFQKANGLQADGKVGPKTWEALGKNLTASATAAPVKKGKKR